MPTSPSPTYYAVLELLTSTVRAQLIPDKEGVPRAGGGAPVLGAPNPNSLVPAFPDLVRAEDPEYFAVLEAGQKEAAYSKSEHMEGLKRAYAAIGEDLRYCFDRKALESSSATTPRSTPHRFKPPPSRSPPGSSSSPNANSRSPPDVAGAINDGALVRVDVLKPLGAQQSSMAEYVTRSGRRVLSYATGATGGLHPAIEIAREQGRQAGESSSLA